MIKQTKDSRRIFDFYTYDPAGKYVVIPIRGIDEADAWDYFEKFYNGYVDQVIPRKMSND